MDEQETQRPIAGQLAIPVPDAPGAIGRWTLDDQFAAYAKEHGMEKALEQKKLADEAADCNCGEQAKEDLAAREADRRARKISGHLHKAGCPQQRAFSRSAIRISASEQEARLNAEHLKGTLRRARDEGRI